MSNTLTNLIPDLFEALNVVSRERTGFISAVNTNHDISRAAENEPVRVPVTRAHSTATNTAGVTAPDTGDTTVDNVSITISKSKHVAVRFSGVERTGLSNAGIYSSIMAQRFAEAMRALANEIEADIYAVARKAASRAYGTAGTTPFATAGDLSDLAQTLKILDDNGCPDSDLQYVLSSAAMANMRGKMSNLFKVNEAGSADMLRNGLTDRLVGAAIRYSGQISTVTKGTGTSYQVNNGAGYAAGDTAITLDTGSGTGLAGDVVTFAGDSNKYVVGTALASNVITLNKPGLLATLADNTAMTIGNNFTPCLAFDRNAIVLATRLPSMPDGGDAAVDVQYVTDPVSGLTFEAALYKQYLQNVIHIRLAWGTAAIKSEHIAMTLG